MEINYGCRWEEGVEYALELLGGGKEILRVSYEADYQGYLDIDVLLNDGRVFSYKYWYGSCSGCDAWEDATDDDVRIMCKQLVGGALIFQNLEECKKFLSSKKDATQYNWSEDVCNGLLEEMERRN